jgi:hypothetical protein
LKRRVLMDQKMIASELVKVAELLLGGKKASLDLEMASLEEIEKIANFLAGGLSHRDAAIASYCLNSLVDGEYGGLVWNLYKKAVAKYKDGMLSWFSEALLDRANVVNFGGLNGALTEFVKAIPDAALRGDSPKVPPFRKDWGFLNADRLTAAGRKVVSVLITDAKAAGLWKDATSGSGLGAGQELQKNEATGVFFLPYSDWTKTNQNLLRGMGFKPDWISAKWFLGRMTPEVEGFFSKEPTKAVRPSQEEFSGWYFKSWLPKNIARFNNLFENYVRDAGSTIKFSFNMTDRGDVKVEMNRGVTRLSQAVEELRLRYLGRNGREP